MQRIRRSIGAMRGELTLISKVVAVKGNSEMGNPDGDAKIIRLTTFRDILVLCNHIKKDLDTMETCVGVCEKRV